ncbi:energy-coupling factor ABC transporter ATP-binding protein [Solirubrobacter ginsenosidimutans]|uniref:energy-coupling factor ABC transporter ATP-binding protein n=1 Tax=Solirubrobacter ginsenosidimutans TaxID=490573 RepID=UPI003556364F
MRPAPAVNVAPGTPPALELEGLAFAYPDGTPALAGIDLSLLPGERLAVLGPNGAGKTTLALGACGALDEVRGVVRVGGEVPGRRELRRRVGIVFQDPDDQLFMPTVEADVAFGPAKQGLRGEELRARVDEALDAVRATDLAARPPHSLSAGERRRVAIAGVLACRPDVLVLDEPTAALDPAGRRELLDVLVSLRLALLLITHDLPYALELCPRAVVLDRGQLVADGATREVLADDGFMRAHRLELPAGFNPLVA